MPAGSRPSGTDSFTVNVPAVAASVPTTFSNPATVTPSSSTPSTSGGLVVDVAEDAWQGDAQFIATVDGRQVGGVYTATALNRAGQSQAISLGTVSPG